MNRMLAITPPPLNLRLWLRRHFVAFVIVFAALVTIAEGNLPRAETHRIEEPCGITLIGACLPRRVATWERTQGAVVEATRGFTLLELAIVLTVIGLIVGGILWGADMIGAAATRAQITQFQQYQTAFEAFQTKYNCLPGDCANATTFGLGANGNGDGLLETNTGAWGTTTTPDGYFDGEFPLFFQHLSAAGLIKGNFNGVLQLGVGYPQLAIKSGYGMIAGGQWQQGGTGTSPDELVTNYGFPQGIFLYVQMCSGALNTPNGSIPANANDGCGIMTPNQTWNIDKKIDDGNPLSGKFWGYSAGAFTDCLNGTNTAYNLQATTSDCQASYQIY